MNQKLCPNICRECKLQIDGKTIHYLAKGLCRSCYKKQWWIKKKSKKPKEKSVDLGWCQSCKREWNTEFIKKSRDKYYKNSDKKWKTIKMTNELCRSCYTTKRHKIKTCEKCGTEITKRTMKKICDMCSVSIWSSINEEDKKDILRNISSKRAEELRLLLNRYKLGIWTEVDHFRVIDAYLELVLNETGQPSMAYESLSGENQIRMMLKDLDSLYSMFKKRMTTLNNIYKHGERKTNKSN